jgi:hypothetical protein
MATKRKHTETTKPRKADGNGKAKATAGKRRNRPANKATKTHKSTDKRASRSKPTISPKKKETARPADPKHIEWTPVVLEELAASKWHRNGETLVYDLEGAPARFRARVRERLGEHFDIRVSDGVIRKALDIARWLATTVGGGFAT